MKRFFGRKEGDFVVIDGEELVHLAKVLRQKVGDKIACICNDENQYFCQIESLDKKICKAKIEKIERCTALPQKDITLFQALPKKEYLDEIVTKSVELGLSTLQLFVSDFSNTSKINLERINSQILAASKQCGRSKLMRCNSLIEFDKMLKLLKNFDLVIFANEKEKQNGILEIKNLESAQKIAVIVGNEGGFSENEIAKLLKEDIVSTTLGRRILRCTTAVATILALINALTKN